MRIWIRAGALLVATVVLVSIASSTGREHHMSTGPAPGGAASGVKLVAYTSCADMLAGLRRQTAANVGCVDRIRAVHRVLREYKEVTGKAHFRSASA